MYLIWVKISVEKIILLTIIILNKHICFFIVDNIKIKRNAKQFGKEGKLNLLV